MIVLPRRCLPCYRAGGAFFLLLQNNRSVILTAAPTRTIEGTMKC